MARGFRVECDDSGVKHVELESWAKWMLGICAALVAFGIPASIGFAVTSRVAAGVADANAVNQERRISLIEVSIAGMALDTARTANDVAWIKRQWIDTATRERQ